MPIIVSGIVIFTIGAILFSVGAVLTWVLYRVKEEEKPIY